MLYIAKISKFPKCIVLKSLTMQKGHSTISREAAFRTNDVPLTQESPKGFSSSVSAARVKDQTLGQRMLLVLLSHRKTQRF